MPRNSFTWKDDARANSMALFLRTPPSLFPSSCILLCCCFFCIGDSFPRLAGVNVAPFSLPLSHSYDHYKSTGNSFLLDHACVTS
jgi:hypothetical protein